MSSANKNLRMQAEEALQTTRTEGTFRRAGASGWEFPRLAGRAWSTGLPDEHGGRCHEPHTGSYGQGRDDLGSCGVLRTWIEKHGVLRALYTDWKNVYLRQATLGEQLRGEAPVTQFGRMCQKLNIRIVAASSPQAKGRVGRNHGTHQDRLIKKMQRKGIDSYEAANQFLENEYLPEHNRRFTQPAAKPEDYHGRRPTARELRQIFRLETERLISNDSVIRHDGHYLQSQPGSRHGLQKTRHWSVNGRTGRWRCTTEGSGSSLRKYRNPCRNPVRPRRQRHELWS